MEKKDSSSGGIARVGGRYGPIRSNPYVRSTVRWDYAPDICKDFKETGFCTFGDSCKFLHDRGDYKHGWELERDWEAGRLKEAKSDEYAVASDEDQKVELPRLCFLCHNSLKNPVVTKCKHYFCEKCAIDHYRKSKKCAECGLKTDGCFSVAKMKHNADNDEQVESASNENKDNLEEDKHEDLPDDEEEDTVDLAHLKRQQKNRSRNRKHSAESSDSETS